ncbi:MAG: DUF2207 domain-containing protein [Planctomycetota bacterium]|jgi:hypothetical protein
MRSIANISILLIIFFSLCIPANAQSDIFTWNYIYVDIEIQENGDLLISEEQKYSFKTGHNEKWDARYRWLPMDKLDDIRDVEVYELARNGKVFSEPLSLTHKIQKKEGRIWIWWWHELNAPETHTFLLEYRVIGGLRINKPTDELRWHAFFENRPAVVERSRVIVHLPPPLHGKIRKVTSYGAFASLNIAPDKSTVEFNSIGAIKPQRGFEVCVSFPHKILKIKRPNWQPHHTLWERFRGRWGIGSGTLVAIVIIVMGIEFYRRWCPECGKIWGLRYTGDKENLNAGKFYWFLRDNIGLYRCKGCGYEKWKKMGY